MSHFVYLQPNWWKWKRVQEESFLKFVDKPSDHFKQFEMTVQRYWLAVLLYQLGCDLFLNCKFCINRPSERLEVHKMLSFFKCSSFSKYVNIFLELAFPSQIKKSLFEKLRFKMGISYVKNCFNQVYIKINV